MLLDLTSYQTVTIIRSNRKVTYNVIRQTQMLMYGKVTHKNLIDNRPLFRYYSSIWIEKTSLIQYNKVSGRYLYEGKNTNH